MMRRLLLCALLTACAAPLEGDEEEDEQCTESDTSMTYEPDDMGSEQMVYAGEVAVMPLRGPSSQLLTIPFQGTQLIAWNPTDRRACDVEIRAGIVAWKVVAGTLSIPDPNVRWWLDVGHGKYVWNDPPPALVPQNVPLVERSYLPTRGLCVRVSSRELRFNARFDGGFLASLNTFTEITLSVSFMPVHAMERPLYPYEDVVVPSVGGKLVKFPATAKEWRLFDREGRPYTAAAHTDVDLISIGGGVDGPYDRNVWADFMPISPRMWGWNLSGLDASTQPVYAQYR